MKSVLFINTNIAWGGGEKWHFHMAQELVQNGFQVKLLIHPRSALKQELKQTDISYEELSLGNLSVFNPFVLMKSLKRIQALKPKIIFVNLPRDAKLIALLAPYLGEAKLIYRRGMPHPLKKNFFNSLIAKRMDLFIANSKTIQKSLCQNFPFLAKKTHVIENGVEILPELSFKDLQEKIILGNLGRLVEQKGQHYLLAIAKKLKEKSISFEIKIAGSGALETELRNEIKKQDLSNEVKLLGYQDAKDFFPKIDLFVFPSLFEGSANALLESFQYGKPAIAFDTSSMPEVISNGINGHLVPVGDIDAICEKIIHLQRKPELLKKMHFQTQITLKEDFNYQQKVQQIIEVINE